MEWPTHLLTTFIWSNVAIFGCYSTLAFYHFQDVKDRGLLHWLYGGFIGSCGVGHLIMAAHMSVYPSPIAMTLSHFITAVVSVATVVAVGKRNE